jgi:hypothetical protein
VPSTLDALDTIQQHNVSCHQVFTTLRVKSDADLAVLTFLPPLPPASQKTTTMPAPVANAAASTPVKVSCFLLLMDSETVVSDLVAVVRLTPLPSRLPTPPPPLQPAVLPMRPRSISRLSLSRTTRKLATELLSNSSTLSRSKAPTLSFDLASLPPSKPA